MGEQTTDATDEPVVVETTDVVERNSTTLLTESGNTDEPEAKADEPVAVEGEPEEGYADFTLPEGQEMDEALLGKASTLFKDVGLTQEQAQKFIDFQAAQMKANNDASNESFNASQKEWVDQIKADKDIGGDNFNTSVANAKAALEKFGTPELTQMLDESGMGSHPELIRLLSTVGALTREDNPLTGNPSKAKKSRADILYPQ